MEQQIRAAVAARRFNKPQLIALSICAAALLLFLTLSYSAVRTKSATYDEPMGVLAAWTQLHLGDYRMNFEDPPLWHYFASLPNGRDSIQFDENDQYWREMPDYVYNEFLLGNRVLYQTRPANDGAAFLNRARFMLVLMGVALGAVLATWAWKLGGPVAGVTACALYCLDPNFLGHSALVKNDVPMSLMITAVLLACWQVGKRLTAVNSIALCLLVAVAANTKFSVVLLAPMIVLLLLLRTLLLGPWVVLGRSLVRPIAKAATAAGLLVGIAMTSYVGIWASYGFRFGPSPDPNITLNTIRHKSEARKYGFIAEFGGFTRAPFDPTMPLEQLLEQYPAKLGHLDRTIEKMRALLAEIMPMQEMHQMVNYSLDPTRNTPEVWDCQELLKGLSESNAVPLLASCRQSYESAVKFLKNTPSPELRAENYKAQLAQMCEKLHSEQVTIDERIYLYERFIYHIRWFMKPPMVVRIWDVLHDYRVLPSAWLHGILFVYARSIVRGSYLLGQVSEKGWWYYFPIAMTVKAPVTSICTLLASLALGVWVVKKRFSQWRQFAWALGCLLVPFLVFMTSVMTSKLNIGVRHVLPVYPLMYVTAGVLIAIAWRRWGKRIWIAAGIAGVMLLAETTLAWPNYVAYFNFAVGGPNGGIRFLSDSNLDWGQDLPLLKKWQDEHPVVRIALSYFPEPVADPHFYGLVYDPLPSGPPPPNIASTHILAVGATQLQGVYGNPISDFTYYQNEKPFEILGGTIYLYDLRANKQ